MSDLVVFIGPTLTPDEVRAVLPHAVIRPPVALGDLTRALELRPRAVVMIDGLFERVPSVWHKEVLFALKSGVAVYGAASMGALRAAELHPFGMVGVGPIFEQFADGRLEDDDEVAVAHLGAEDDHRAVSEAMVNIRATCTAAVAEGAMTVDEADVVCATAKQLFYPERTWARVLDEVARSDSSSPTRIGAIRTWIDDGGRVDQKATDARAALARVAEDLGRGIRAPDPDWEFEHTSFWARALNELATDDADDGAPAESGTVAERVLDELRLEPEAYRAAHEDAFLRWLAGAYAEARSLELREEETQRVLDGLRAELGLWEPADVTRWLEEQEMTEGDLRVLVTDEAYVAWARSMTRRELTPIVIDVLRRQRRYGDLVGRARAKRDDLRARGLDGSQVGDGVSDEDILAWWFRDVRGEAVPTDLDRYAFDHELGDGASLIRTLRREFWYRQVPAAAT